jgi:hypothetical protein
MNFLPNLATRYYRPSETLESIRPIAGRLLFWADDRAVSDDEVTGRRSARVAERGCCRRLRCYTGFVFGALTLRNRHSLAAPRDIARSISGRYNNKINTAIATIPPLGAKSEGPNGYILSVGRENCATTVGRSLIILVAIDLHVQSGTRTVVGGGRGETYIDQVMVVLHQLSCGDVASDDRKLCVVYRDRKRAARSCGGRAGHRCRADREERT